MTTPAFVPEINIKIHDSDIKAIHKMLGHVPRALPRVLNRAINKILVKAHNEIARKIRANIPIKAGVLKRRYVRRFRSTMRTLSARISVSGKRIPIIQLSPRVSRRGVLWGKGKWRKRIPSAFQATMKSGHQGIFARLGRNRFPIHELHGPSVPEVYHNIDEFAGRRLVERLMNELRNEILIQVEVLLKQAARA